MTASASDRNLGPTPAQWREEKGRWNDGGHCYGQQDKARIGSAVETRRRRDRRRRRRSLPIASVAQPRTRGESVRRRIRRRRNLVLEPIPGRALRLGRLHLSVFVFRGAVQGDELEREIPRPAGNP